MEHRPYEAPKVEVVGSISDLTQMPTKFIQPNSDGYFLGVKGDPGQTVPLGS